MAGRGGRMSPSEWNVSLEFYSAVVLGLLGGMIVVGLLKHFSLGEL